MHCYSHAGHTILLPGIAVNIRIDYELGESKTLLVPGAGLAVQISMEHDCGAVKFR